MDSCTAMAETAVAEFGNIDVLVNNAGVALNSVTEDIDIDRAKEVMDVNVWAQCVA